MGESPLLATFNVFHPILFSNILFYSSQLKKKKKCILKAIDDAYIVKFHHQFLVLMLLKLIRCVPADKFLLAVLS